MCDPADLLLYQILHAPNAVAAVVNISGEDVTPVPHSTYLGSPIEDIVAQLQHRNAIRQINGSGRVFRVIPGQFPTSVRIMEVVEQALRESGFEVEMPGSLPGKSGVEHHFDILARGKDRQFMFDIEAPEAPAPIGRPAVLGHHAKVDDLGETGGRTALIAVPRLTGDGRRLAEVYGIDLIEAPRAEELGERVRSFVGSSAAVGQISTGVPALDVMLGGGLMEGGTYLVLGDVGSGKTTLAIQFLLASARRGERGLLITTNSSPSEDVQLADNLGFDLRAQIRSGTITVLSLSSAFDRIARPSETGPKHPATPAARVLEELFSRVEAINPKRIVIDTVTPLVPVRRYEEVREFLRGVARLKRLVLITEEFGLDGGDTAIEEYFVSGVIVLHKRLQPSGSVESTVRVDKHRGALHDPSVHPFTVQRVAGLVVQ